MGTCLCAHGQATGLSDVGGGEHAAELAATGINLQLLDTADTVDDLDDVVAQGEDVRPGPPALVDIRQPARPGPGSDQQLQPPAGAVCMCVQGCCEYCAAHCAPLPSADGSAAAGAVKAARSGLHEEQDEAAQAELLAAVMQHYLMTLSARDRSLLALRIGIRLPVTRSPATSSTATGSGDAAPIAPEQQYSSANIRADTQLLIDVVVEVQSMSLDELAQHFNLNSRQRAIS